MSSRPSRGAARLAAILDALPDALLLVNANGTVVNANTIALDTFEAPGTALVGRGLLDLLPAFDSRLIPGSMRRPDTTDERGRTKPKRMTARRTDGTEFPVEVTSANLDGREAYESQGSGSRGDELLMLVVRDLSGTLDTEAELARSQRQTEMILRAAAEGVVGTDTEGRVVLVNPAAAQILGYRASDLGGRELHTLVQHSRADGEPFPYEESPLADTLRSGRKHRVRGQVLWAKDGKPVAVDLTTAPVRDGDQLVGAVLTFTDRRPYDALQEQLEQERAAAQEKYDALAASEAERYAELEAGARERYADLREREAARYEQLAERERERYAQLSARHAQLLAVLGESLRGPLEHLRAELGTLADDPAGQLWPEANQILHHLAAGYTRMTTLVDNVLNYQLLDDGSHSLHKVPALLDRVVTAGVEGAAELIGPGRAQFAVHAPPIEAEVDAARLATALAHLIADVAGIDSTGNARVADPSAGYVDSTIVVAVAQRGDVVRIEVRGPFAGGDPVHAPLVAGIVRAHGGVLQTHEVPGMGGSAFVLEVPIGSGAGTVEAAPAGSELALPEQAAAPDGAAAADVASVAGNGDTAPGSGGRRRARRASVDSFLDNREAEPAPVPAAPADQPAPTGRRRRRAAAAGEGDRVPAQVSAESDGGGISVTGGGGGTGRRRRAHAEPVPNEPAAEVAQGAVVTAAEHAAGAPAGAPGLGAAVPPQGVPAEAGAPTGRRARRASSAVAALPPAAEGAQPQPTGRRRRALAAAAERAAAEEAGSGRTAFALPPAEADRTPGVTGEATVLDDSALPAAHPHDHAGAHPHDHAGAHSHDERGAAAHGAGPAQDAAPRADEVAAYGLPAGHTPPQPHPAEAPSGRRRARPEVNEPVRPGGWDPSQQPGVQELPAAEGFAAAQKLPGHQELPAAQGLPSIQESALDFVAQSRQGAAEGAVQDGAVQASSQPAPPQSPQSPVAAQEAAGPSAQASSVQASSVQDVPAVELPAQQASPVREDAAAAEQAAGPEAGPQQHPGAGPQPATPARPRIAQPLPAEAAADPGASQGRGFSVRTLGQGVPFAQHFAEQQRRPGLPPLPSARSGQSLGGQAPAGSGRRRKLGTPPDPRRSEETPAGGTPAGGTPASGTPAAGTPASGTPTGGTPAAGTPTAGVPTVGTPAQGTPQHGAPTHGTPAPGMPAATAPVTPAAPEAPTAPVSQPLPPMQQPERAPAEMIPGRAPAESQGRAYAIEAPDEGAEGPQALDGPGGAVEVANRPQPLPMDDELPPEPLDNPRRLLVWPAPDVSTQQALSDRGYRPVIVHSREEVDAQIAAFPAALFVDPLTGPITRTALQALRQAAVAAEVPVLVTAGLGQASREAAYGADPAVLLKALAPRDSEQHPPRVLLIEEHEEIAQALTASLERRGMQVARAASDADAVTLATQMRPNLVVMDLLQVRRRRAGIVDWLRANGQLNRTPLVVYTAAVDQSDLPKLASGETVLFLAERSTSVEVQTRIVDLLAKIGTN
ncbi:PAS domain-containing protein [Streptomyces indicus]|uniref:histidine kinase n=1 Tax=Streptomyces indicus TaxID=417292 RepID=A0A1G9ES76_9ACTN|nr:PAS domain-containing protein [Streptomyces indicus]SDK78980.1 PAS domain S-box-containing protein [Streptomyces indicus]